jgi:hypothetical protein
MAPGLHVRSMSIKTTHVHRHEKGSRYGWNRGRTCSLTLLHTMFTHCYHSNRT